MRGQPHQMRGDALQLGQDDPHGLGPRRDVEPDQLLDRQDIDQDVAHRVEVVHPVGHHAGLGVRLGFHVLLDAGMQEADIGDAVDDPLAVELEQQTQHAVRARMLRTHVEQHRLALQGAIGDQVLQFVDRDFEGGGGHG